MDTVTIVSILYKFGIYTHVVRYTIYTHFIDQVECYCYILVQGHVEEKYFTETEYLGPGSWVTIFNK